MFREDIFKANIELNEKEIKEGKVALESKPRMLMLMLGSDCNLSCIMCPRSDSGGALSHEAFEKITCLFPYLELINWGGGGEPFLAANFKKFFFMASGYQQIRHDITTNGLLIDEEWVGILAQNNVLLTYSIDSPKKDTYEYIRKGARYEDLIKSIETVNKAKERHNGKIKLILNAVVMKRNYKELHLFPEFCKKYNFQQLRLEYLRPVINPEQDIFTVRKDQEAIQYLKKEMPEIESKCKDLGIKLESCIRVFLNSPHHNKDDSNGLINNCRLPWMKLLIDGSAGGRITPDCLCKYPAGNILDNSIEEVWNNDIMQRYRRNILNKTAEGWCSEQCLIYERKGSA